MDDDGSVAFETISQETPFAASGARLAPAVCHGMAPGVRDAGFPGICRSRGGCGLSVDERGAAFAAGAELRVRAGYVVRTASWHANPVEGDGFSA
ncbi:hypothetical protein MRX96_032494 [Rhipicephalus microplus]